MPNSLRCKIKHLRHNGTLTERECDRILKALEQQPCEDAISRQAVLDMATTIQTDDFSGNEIIEVVDVDDIKALSPVTPQPKTGHWIAKDGFDGDTYYDCSECGESFCLIYGTPTDNLYNYCPNCGAKMEVSEEDE